MYRGILVKRKRRGQLRGARRLCLQLETGAVRDRAAELETIRPDLGYRFYCTTVTARRFCDQHEMSSQIATGRSLPNDFMLRRFDCTPLLIR